jgi:hypothetical protein
MKRRNCVPEMRNFTNDWKYDSEVFELLEVVTVVDVLVHYKKDSILMDIDGSIDGPIGECELKGLSLFPDAPKVSYAEKLEYPLEIEIQKDTDGQLSAPYWSDHSVKVDEEGVPGGLGLLGGDAMDLVLHLEGTGSYPQAIDILRTIRDKKKSVIQGVSNVTAKKIAAILRKKSASRKKDS